MLHDPLVGAVCSPDEVWHLVDEMLVTQAPWLPQYAHAIPAARQRLASNGSVLTDSTNRGAVRKKIKNIDELRQDNFELACLAAGDGKKSLD